MSLLLLLLAGAVTAGAGLWAFLGGSKKDPSDPKDGGGPSGGGGPRSSPGLPGSGGQRPTDRGKPITLGGKDDLQQVRDLLKKAPDTIAAKAVSGEPGAPKPKPRTSKRPLKVTYTADEIISRASKHAHHRRALQNADVLVEKQKGQEALSIYERTKSRVPDPTIEERLDQNIEDIKRWLSGLDVEEDESLQFPEIVLPITIQGLAIENLTLGIRSIAEGIAAQLDQGLKGRGGQASASGSGPSIPSSGGGASSGSAGASGSTSGGASSGPTSGGGMSAGVPGAGSGGAITGGFSGTPIVIQVAPGGVTGGTAGGPTGGAPGGGAGTLSTGVPITVNLGTGGGSSGAGVGGAAGGIAYSGEMAPSSPFDQGNYKSPPPLDVTDQGQVSTDGWTDDDFEEEWKKFENLPLKDRRSGKERRQATDRRKQDPTRKDRRSGEDRRKKDLFKERDEFLKKLEEHKKNKEAQAQQQKAQRPPIQPAQRPPEGFPREQPKDYPPEPRREQPAARGDEERQPSPSEFRLAPETLSPLNFPAAVDTALPKGGEGAAPGEKPATSAEPEQELGEGVQAAEMPENMTAGGDEGADADGGSGDEKEEKTQVQEIRGVLELKPPDEDDAPFLALTYDFTKIPDSFKLSRDYHTMEYAYYKYKPMLVKAQEFSRRKMLKNALNYYRVIKSQNIPPEFRRMINRNIQDITEYLEKFLMSRN